MMMAKPSGAHHQEREAAQPGSYDASSAPSSSFNGNNSVSSALNNSSATPPAPALYHNPEISSDWTAEEQLILEEGLFKYASESNVNRYAKIALHLRNKTVRDVALRCRWMVKKEISKRRKEDNNSVMKIKERKEKINYPAASSSHFAASSSFPSHAQGMVTNDFDDGILYTVIGGVMGQLIQQNTQAFKQISANLAVHKFHENIGLFCKARDNILKILDNFRNVPETMKNMPPLPVRMNEQLANSILPHARMKS